MSCVGYVPFTLDRRRREASLLEQYLRVATRVVPLDPCWNVRRSDPLPPLAMLADRVERLIELPHVVLEGPGGLFWGSVLREHGYSGTLTVLPYVNPRGWQDVLAATLFGRYATARDRVFVGSTPSARVLAAFGVRPSIGEPFGIDDEVFRRRPDAGRVRDRFGIPPGRVLIYAGRAEPDKDIYRLLRVGLKAQLLFPDLTVVLVSHVIDSDYMERALQVVGRSRTVQLIRAPETGDLADLYNIADVFVTASASHYETFGRAPAEALACGCPVVAGQYAGFAELVDQDGGVSVGGKVDACSGAPSVDEEALLRAVFEVLSSPRPPNREAISATARRRFGRSRTIAALGYLRAGEPDPLDAVEPAPLLIPVAWREHVADALERTPRDALGLCWDGDLHERLSRHDDEFRDDVRRTLWDVARPRPEGVACP